MLHDTALPNAIPVQFDEAGILAEFPAATPALARLVAELRLTATFLDRTGQTMAADVRSALDTRLHAVCEQIESFPTTTVADIGLKAEAQKLRVVEPANATDGSQDQDTELLIALGDLRRLDLAIDALGTTAPGDARDLNDLPAWGDLEARRDAALDQLATTGSESLTGLRAKAQVLQMASVRDEGYTPSGRCFWEDIATSLARDILDLPLGAIDSQCTTADPGMARGPNADLTAMLGGTHNDDGTVNFCDAAGRVLRKPTADWIRFTAMRLYSEAQTETARQLCDVSLSDESRAALAMQLRRDLRMDALGILAFRADAAFSVGQPDGEGAIPKPRDYSNGVVSADLIRATEAHREARQLCLHDPVEDDDRLGAHVARVSAAAAAINALPSRSLADLRHKLLCLWPGSLEGEVADADFAAALSAFRADVERLGGDEIYGDAPDGSATTATTPNGDLPSEWPDPVALTKWIDLTVLDADELAGLHDAAGLLRGVANAVVCQPKCTIERSDGDYRTTSAGIYAGWVADVGGCLRDRIHAETMGRLPWTTDRDRDLLLEAVGSYVIQNGDKAEMQIFAQALNAEISAHV